MRLCFRHLAILAGILLCIAAVYHNVTSAYYCSDDDFLELHRAAFEDARSPARIFTTSHFGTFKYRPLNRLLNRVTYQAGNGAPWPFRARNLAWHMLNAAAVYTLALLLGKPLLVAALAALLFGVHPMANQSVIGAVMTNTGAATAYLAALISFILAARRPRAALQWCGFALSATVAMFLYDTYVVVFGSAVFYLLVFELWLRRRVPKGKLVAVFVSAAFAIGLYLGLRLWFVPSGYAGAASNVPAVKVMAASIAVYGGGLLLPFDPVLANAWFAAPLPSDPAFHMGTYRLLLVGSAAATSLVLFALVWCLMRAGRAAETWAGYAFLAVTAALPLIPVLIFTDHPSETYLYGTVACGSLLVVSLAFDCASVLGKPGRYAAIGLAAACALLFAAGTLERNGRVAECGATAQRILAAVPVSGSTFGGRVAFTDAPGEPVAPRYGFYRLSGLDTIANRTGIRSRTLTCALQLTTGNERIMAEVPEPGTAIAPPDAGRAYWVHRDGRLQPISTAP